MYIYKLKLDICMHAWTTLTSILYEYVKKQDTEQKHTMSMSRSRTSMATTLRGPTSQLLFHVWYIVPVRHHLTHFIRNII
jgi:hypothetical protein